MQYDDYEILKKAKLSAITRVRTADIYKVKAFYPENQTVDIESCVLPFIYDINGELKEDMFGEHRKMSQSKTPITIFRVPVQQFRCGQFSITAPLQVGDTGLLIFLKNDIEKWKVEGDTTGALFVTPFNINSCVFSPFVPNESNKDSTFNANSLEIKSKSVIIRVNEETVEVTATESDITGNVKISGDLDVGGNITAGGDMTATGNVTATGTVTGSDCVAGAISLTGHVHGGVTTGEGTTGTPQ